MSTEFLSFLPPPYASISSYNRSLPPGEQPDEVPLVFIDAMTVREDVFVKEQNVPLENELDSEDARCYHWVAYASVGAARGAASAFQESSSNAQGLAPGGRKGSRVEELARRRSGSTASRTPVGTIRLVPPIPVYKKAAGNLDSRKSSYSGASRRASGDAAAQTAGQTNSPEQASSDPSSPGQSGSEYPHPTTFPGEPYIRLGRLATLKPYRGLGLSKLLINAVLQWAKTNRDQILPPQDAAEIESAKLEGHPIQQPWNGLVIVHAQVGKTDGLWKRYGFTVDEGMGEWDEEGMMHIGMWKRLEIPEKKSNLSRD